MKLWLRQLGLMAFGGLALAYSSLYVLAGIVSLVEVELVKTPLAESLEILIVGVLVVAYLYYLVSALLADYGYNQWEVVWRMTAFLLIWVLLLAITLPKYATGFVWVIPEVLVIIRLCLCLLLLAVLFYPLRQGKQVQTTY